MKVTFLGRSATALFAVTMFSGAALADIAIDLDPFNSSGGTPVADSNHGWEFVVNDPIVVTHLGLFDDDEDGFDISHPIGLFRLTDAALLASGTISAGTGDPLVDFFRYIDVPDVALDVGEIYVVSYYSATDSGDLVITAAAGLTVAPEITYTNGRWGSGTGGLGIPANSTGADRFGPNFMFIPGPSALALIGLAGLCGRRRRRG